ncbi:MAG: LmrA/YxaF family transcription factor [Vulcanimicrobiaceae bacterium]
MPAALLSKEEIISRILTVFRKNGYDGASLSDFEQATGLGRSSLYHLTKSFSKWVDALQAIAVEAGLPKKQARERAEDVVLMIQGALVLSGGMDDPAPFKRVLRKIPQTLFD